MRYNEILREVRVTVWSGSTINVIHNPTRHAFERFAAERGNNLRGLLSYDGNNVYLWDAMAAVHPNITQELGLEHVNCIAYRRGRWEGPDLVDEDTGRYVPAIERITPRKLDISDDELLRRLHEGVFYHGTSTASANYLLTHGFSTTERGRGMGSGIEPFTFLTPSRSAALWYASENFHNEDGGKVLSVTYPANVFQTSKRQKNALQAFAEAGDHLAVPKPDPSKDIFDSDLIAQALLDHGYNAIAFRDRDAGGRSALIALRPELIKVNQ